MFVLINLRKMFDCVNAFSNQKINLYVDGVKYNNNPSCIGIAEKIFIIAV